MQAELSEYIYISSPARAKSKVWHNCIRTRLLLFHADKPYAFVDSGARPPAKNVAELIYYTYMCIVSTKPDCADDTCVLVQPAALQTNCIHALHGHLLGLISNACYSFSRVAERLQHTGTSKHCIAIIEDWQHTLMYLYGTRDNARFETTAAAQPAIQHERRADGGGTRGNADLGAASLLCLTKCA